MRIDCAGFTVRYEDDNGRVEVFDFPSENQALQAHDYLKDVTGIGDSQSWPVQASLGVVVSLFGGETRYQGGTTYHDELYGKSGRIAVGSGEVCGFSSSGS